MISLRGKVPGYLLSKSHLIGTVSFVSLFSLLVLISSIPFSNNAWFELRMTQAFLYTMIYCMSALVLISASKWLLFKVFKNRNYEMTYAFYIGWLILEVVLLALLYSLLTLEALRKGIINLDLGFLPTFLKALEYGLISLGFPYVISAMYFAINDKDNTIRVMNYGSVVSDEILQPKDEKKITLFDNSGVLKLSVSSTNLYYIESDDNYIKVWYTDAHDSLKQYMLRCRLKTVEESFADSSLVRCHRKYIVNLDKVKVLRKEKDSYELDLDNENIDPIPITKTYEENVLACFNSSKA